MTKKIIFAAALIIFSMIFLTSVLIHSPLLPQQIKPCEGYGQLSHRVERLHTGGSFTAFAVFGAALSKTSVTHRSANGRFPYRVSAATNIILTTSSLSI